MAGTGSKTRFYGNAGGPSGISNAATGAKTRPHEGEIKTPTRKARPKVKEASGSRKARHAAKTSRRKAS